MNKFRNYLLNKLWIRKQLININKYLTTHDYVEVINNYKISVNNLEVYLNKIIINENSIRYSFKYDAKYPVTFWRFQMTLGDWIISSEEENNIGPITLLSGDSVEFYQDAKAK